MNVSAESTSVLYDFPQTTETLTKFLRRYGLVGENQNPSRYEMLMILYRNPNLIDELKTMTENTSTLKDSLSYALIENVPGHGLGLAPGEKPRILQWIESGLISWDEIIQFIPSQPTKERLASNFREWVNKNYPDHDMSTTSDDTAAAAEIQKILQYGDADLRRYVVLHMLTKFWQGIPLPDTENDDGTLSFTDWQDEVNKRFGAFVAPEMCRVETAINQCTSQNGEARQKRIYQQMMQFYFTMETSKRIRGQLICWNVGAGKTCGLHAMAANFYRKNLKYGYGPNHPDRWRLIWVTRRNLLSVPDSEEMVCFKGSAQMTMKNAYELMSITQLFNMLRSFFNISGLVTTASGETKLVAPYSKDVEFAAPILTDDGKYIANYGTNRVFARYRDTSKQNVLNSWMRNPTNRELRKTDPLAADTEPSTLDPLWRTVIIFDEIHLLYDATIVQYELGIPDQKDAYGKVVMRGGTLVMEGLKNMLHHSYKVSGMDSARCLASTATPFSDDSPMMFPKMLNMFIAEEDKRLPETYDAFSARYFNGPNNEYINPEAFVKDFLIKTRGLISYLDNKNPGEFAQMEGGKPQIEVVPMTDDQYSFVLKCLANSNKRPIVDETKDIDTTQLEATVDPEEMVKRVICTRNAAMFPAPSRGAFSISAPWATLDREAFRPDLLKEKLPTYAPKVYKMFQNIEKIDAEYAAAHGGKKPKHVIYSGLNKGWGGKFIASGLAALGYQETFFENDEFVPNLDPKESAPRQVDIEKGNFVLITTSRYYHGKRQVKASWFQKRRDWQQKKVKESKWNTMETIIGHRDNLNGEKARIIVLGGNFSEGVNIKETLFMHIIEPAITDQKEMQIAGRIQRSCGQKYQGFIYGRGFPNITVIVYKETLPNERAFVHKLPDGRYIREDPLQFAKRIYRNAIPPGPGETVERRENEAVENTYKNMFEMMYLSSFDRHMNRGFNCALDTRVNNPQGRFVRSVAASFKEEPPVVHDNSPTVQSQLQNLLLEESLP